MCSRDRELPIEISEAARGSQCPPKPRWPIATTCRKI